jgi:hypothetical protein
MDSMVLLDEVDGRMAGRCWRTVELQPVSMTKGSDPGEAGTVVIGKPRTTWQRSQTRRS